LTQGLGPAELVARARCRPKGLVTRGTWPSPTRLAGLTSPRHDACLGMHAAWSPHPDPAWRHGQGWWRGDGSMMRHKALAVAVRQQWGGRDRRRSMATLGFLGPEREIDR
jgi:hypothetical protein